MNSYNRSLFVIYHHVLSHSLFQALLKQLIFTKKVEQNYNSVDLNEYAKIQQYLLERFANHYLYGV